MLDKLTIYESWDLEKPTIPPRSRLYQLKPIGVGTSDVESLTSYVARLAQAHCVSIRRLYLEEIFPLTKRGDVCPGQNQVLHIIRKHSDILNGTKLNAATWVQAIGILTNRADLHCLTMLAWAKVLSQRELLRPVRAWCPLCYEEWQLAGQVIYDPLIWALDVIKACPHHCQRLETCCPHCHKQPFLLESQSRPGYCPKCGKWLGVSSQVKVSDSKALTEDELKWQIWVIQNVGELIAAVPRLSSYPSRERISKAISIYATQLTEGNITAFARLVGKKIATLHPWHTGKSIPQLIALLQICFCIRTSLLNFLIGDVVTIDSDEAVRQINDKQQQKSKKVYKQPLELEQLQKALTLSLTEYPPPPLAEMTRRLGCSRDILQWNFPILSRKVVERYVDYRKAKLEDKRSILLSVLESEENPPISVREVARRIGVSDSYIRIYFPDLCHLISKRYIEYHKNKSQKTIEKLCQEVRQVALELDAQGVNPHSGNVGKHLLKPGILRHKDVASALQEVRCKLGYKK
jgi:hypothetical protein